MEKNMNSDNQFNQNISDSCVKAIEDGVDFYNSIARCGISNLRQAAIEFISEVIDCGRMNLTNFDDTYVNIGNKFITVAEIDKLLFSDTLSIAASQSSITKENNHVKQ